MPRKASSARPSAVVTAGLRPADRGPDPDRPLRLDLVEVDDLRPGEDPEVHELVGDAAQRDERRVQQGGEVLVAEEVVGQLRRGRAERVGAGRRVLGDEPAEPQRGQQPVGGGLVEARGRGELGQRPSRALRPGRAPAGSAGRGRRSRPATCPVPDGSAIAPPLPRSRASVGRASVPDGDAAPGRDRPVLDANSSGDRRRTRSMSAKTARRCVRRRSRASSRSPSSSASRTAPCWSRNTSHGGVLGQPQPAGPVEVALRGDDRGPGPLVPGQPQQPLVERLVETEEGLRVVVGGRLLGEVASQLGDLRRVGLGGDVGERGELDRLPQELRVGHALGVDARDERPDLREDLHEPLLRQQDQALPHGRARDAELGRQLVLGQRRARRELEGDDPAPELVVDGAAAGPGGGGGMPSW